VGKFPSFIHPRPSFDRSTNQRQRRLHHRSSARHAAVLQERLRQSTRAVTEDAKNPIIEQLMGHFTVVDSVGVSRHLARALLNAVPCIGGVMALKVETRALVRCDEVLPVIRNIFDQEGTAEVWEAAPEHSDGTAAE
jgi:hypothetical protein